MLTENQLYAVEAQAIDDYMEVILSNRYSNEVVNGDIQKWRDADDYYTVPGSCTISGDTIKDWLIDRFDSLIEEFLYKSNKSQALSELAEDSDLADEESYYDFVYDKCEDIEQYFWSSDLFEDLCNEYFEEYGEES